MIHDSIIRKLSPLKVAEYSASHYKSLCESIRLEARKVGNSIRCAREAAAYAALDYSDDVEREDARRKATHALRQYVALVAKGNPPIHLDEQGRVKLSENAITEGNEEGLKKEDEIAKPENDVMKILAEDVEALKHEIFMANKQRVWMAWRGWF